MAYHVQDEYGAIAYLIFDFVYGGVEVCQGGCHIHFIIMMRVSVDILRTVGIKVVDMAVAKP